MTSSIVVVHPITVVCLFIMLYYHFIDENIHYTHLYTLSSALFIGSALLAAKGRRWQYIHVYVFFQAFLGTVAPILCTLTASISLDTLWAMSVAMLFIHLVFYGYNKQQELLYNAISLNTAIFAAVCLASTMATSRQGFVLVSLSAHLFALSGILLDKHMHYLTVPLAMATFVLCLGVSYLAAVFYGAVVVAVTTVCPLWLYHLQDLKNNIYGPWDEATVQSYVSEQEKLGGASTTRK